MTRFGRNESLAFAALARSCQSNRCTDASTTRSLSSSPSSRFRSSPQRTLCSRFSPWNFVGTSRSPSKVRSSSSVSQKSVARTASAPSSSRQTTEGRPHPDPSSKTRFPSTRDSRPRCKQSATLESHTSAPSFPHPNEVCRIVVVVVQALSPPRLLLLTTEDDDDGIENSKYRFRVGYQYSTSSSSSSISPSPSRSGGADGARTSQHRASSSSSSFLPNT
mmetsp:Transcript_21096/g.50053  ORF Transcript_21096/g.50053 Transcript_21096/m.50053 type:complete len:220 (-) Transcript_21096:246-905(-)